jgi:hypothetical protein
MAISRKRSEAMRLSWARRKAAKLNEETIAVGSVVTAVKLARKLKAAVGGNPTIAHALIDATEESE